MGSLDYLIEEDDDDDDEDLANNHKVFLFWVFYYIKNMPLMIILQVGK